MEIQETITKLRQLTCCDVQNGWCSLSETATINDKDYITWSAGSKVQWLRQKFTIPASLGGYPLHGLSLRLKLTWWAEDAQIFVNGKLVQEGDLFDSSARILLTTAALPEAEIIVQLRLVSPKHDVGALMGSVCIYEDPNNPDPGFVADELTVLSEYLEAFAPDKSPFLAAQLTAIDWRCLTNRSAFDKSLSQLRSQLQPLSPFLKQRHFHLLGHGHLDMAWLWTVEETYTVAERTFASVLNLQKCFPALTFSQSTPALYAWLETHRPDLFQAIQNAVRLGKWEIVGPMWVEPEVNLVGGESLIRQLFYGQLYLEAKFGTIVNVAWLPDSFGFPWQLPQIFKGAGIEYFVTGKLHWNDTNTFPYGVFWWQGPDGTRLLTLMSPPNVAGVMDTNPGSMTNYAINWERQTGLKDVFWLPGVGDHGGGPSRDMLEVQQRWQNSPFFPQMQFTTAKEYLEERIPTESLPIWNDELYLEFHRGCYTTHGDQKLFNRYCEGLLYQAELFSSLLTLLYERQGYRTTPFPIIYDTVKEDSCQGVKEKIEEAWKKVLFNQFHDILPGTSIGEVFVQANQDYQEVIAVGEEILTTALLAIASQIQLVEKPHPEAKPIVIFNSLSWQVSQVVKVALPTVNWQVYNLENAPIPCQVSKKGELLFLAQDIPGIGYHLFWLSPGGKCLDTLPNKSGGQGQDDHFRNQGTDNLPLPTLPAFILENEKLRVVVNPKTGDLKSVWDKIVGREVLNSPGNQLQAFRDKRQYWDAWNIDPDYEKHPLPQGELKSIEWLDKGVVQNSIRVVRKLNKSTFTTDYILETNSPMLKMVTTVDWEESHVLVKAAFPLNLKSDFVTYEIPCGAIERPTEPGAKWEVPALRWADLRDDEYGVSLLNDCKHGYDSKPNQLRLTLLKSPSWPDPKADRTQHQFTYSLYPHPGDWKTAGTVNKGYELNLPLMVVFPQECEGDLPLVSQLLDLGNDSLILMALKPAETTRGWILRCYESRSEMVELNLGSDLDLRVSHAVDLLERPLTQDTRVIEPWKIASFKIGCRV